MASLVVGSIALLARNGGRPTRRQLTLFWRRLKHAKHYDLNLTYEQFLDAQAAISYAKLNRNINPAGTAKGSLVASPSKASPDYFYEWTRDSALSLRPVVQEYLRGRKNVLPIIFDFIDATSVMQHKNTPSGGYRTGGLGEVKFYAQDHNPFTGSWGRPQRDGPALRASLLMVFATRYLQKEGHQAAEFVRKHLFDGLEATETVIKADLDYVCTEWSKIGFDLWEEVNGLHFYTLLVSLRAMREGSSFASLLGHRRSAKRYADTASEIEKVLERFWDAEAGYIRVTVDDEYKHGKTSGLDTCVILAALHAGNQASPYDITSPQLIASHLAIVASMRKEYPLNARFAGQVGAAAGRYPEDIYDGVGTSIANPWFLCTLGHAEYLFRLASALQSTDITVTKELAALSRVALTSNDVMSRDSEDHRAVVKDLRAQGDEYVKIVREFKEPDGAMSEQFDRISAWPRGAHDLTWSYAAFLSMKAARDGEPEF